VTGLVGLILALAKAIPFLNRLLDAVQEARLVSTHNAIDQAIQNARNGPAVCPYGSCPLRVRHAEGEPAPPAS